MNLPVKKEFKYEHNIKGLFIIAYVYPQRGKPFIVKGNEDDVDFYLREHPVPCLVAKLPCKNGKSYPARYSVYGLKHGIGMYHRHYWPIENKRHYTSDFKPFIDKKVRNVKRHVITIANQYGPDFNVLLSKSLRKMPRKWIKELDPFVQ